MSVQELNESTDTFIGPSDGIDLWLARHQPSLNLTIEPWYWVRRPTDKRDYTEGEYTTFMIEGGQLWDELMAECDRIKAEEPVRGSKASGKKSQKELREIEHAKFNDAIEQLAKRCHVLSGKWLFMPSAMWVDNNWAKVAKAVAGPNGALLDTSCSVAKVSASAEIGANYVICVYCEDSYDREAVKKVFDVLHDQLGMSPMSYKTDAFTLLGVYSGNSTQIRTSLYVKADFLPPAPKPETKSPKTSKTPKAETAAGKRSASPKVVKSEEVESKVHRSPSEDVKPSVALRKRRVEEEEEDGAGFDPVSSEEEEDAKPVTKKGKGKK